jgi:uncharacterized protein YqjF (DUF2071 family)
MARSPSLADRLQARDRPLPERPVLFQRWTDLLFLHWQVDPSRLQTRLPPGLTVDLHDGAAYLGLVPFFMKEIRPRACPPVPGLSWFLEMNVRTYVHDDRGRPGVWFFSLDANQPLAVRIARRFFHLPYHDASMAAPRDADGTVHYAVRRAGASAPTRLTYRIPQDETPAPATPGTLEFFLAERYLLFAWNGPRRRLHAGQVRHDPYPLCLPEFSLGSVAALAPAGFPELESRPPDHALASPGVRVQVFALE